MKDEELQLEEIEASQYTDTLGGGGRSCSREREVRRV